MTTPHASRQQEFAGSIVPEWSTEMSENRLTSIAFWNILLVVVLSLLGGCNSDTHDSTPGQTVLAAPTNLAASSGTASVALSWTASADATSYSVKRAVTSGGPYTQIG